MNVEEFSEQLETIRQQTTQLHKTSLEQQLDLTKPVFAQLVTALEELGVAQEELYQQNEELEVTRAEVAAERQRYQELFEHAPDGYLVTDAKGLIQEANRVASQLLNVSQNYLVGKPLANFVTEVTYETFQAHLNQLAQGDWVQELEVGIQPRDSGSFEAALTVSAVRDFQGQPCLLHWLLRDITPRKQAERQIHDLNQVLTQRAAYEVTLNRINDKVRNSLDESQILQTAVQELVRSLNLVCCDTATYDLQAQTATISYQHTGADLPVPSAIGRPVTMADFPEGYGQLLQDQSFQFCELTSDPGRRQFSILACPIVDHQGILGDLWCFRGQNAALNESEVNLVRQVANQCAIAIRQARLYQAVQTQVQELERLHHIKEDFVSTISHELRTPVANMKLAIQMLQLNPNPERQARYFQILQNSCDREIELITDLLDLQRLDSESYPTFLLEAIDLQDWIPIVVAALKQRTQLRQQTLIIDLPPVSPPIVTDRATLGRVLTELLSNAHKYTAAGGTILLKIEYAFVQGVTTFTVRNQATLPPAELSRIFDKFYRVPKVNPWEQGGTGLGLALVKQLVEQLQGTIHVESSDGWTTFAVQLPTQLRMEGE